MESIQKFLSAKRFAVAGASRDREKYGNKIFRALLASGRDVVPINPCAQSIEGVESYPTIGRIQDTPASLSIVTPPHITRQIVREAILSGVKNIWMQPGAEEEFASAEARQAGLNVIDDGSCILVSLAIEGKRISD